VAEHVPAAVAAAHNQFVLDLIGGTRRSSALPTAACGHGEVVPGLPPIEISSGADVQPAPIASSSDVGPGWRSYSVADGADLLFPSLGNRAA
jgi:hypothetical protein